MKSNKNFNRFSEIAVLVLAITVWLFSFYKIISYLKLVGVFGAGDCSAYDLLPPPPPEPPCPPPCPPEQATPTPTIPLPTPTQEPAPTPTEEITPTEIPQPTPTAEEAGPTPTSSPSNGSEGGVGGTGGTGSGGSGGGGPANPPVCSDATPGSAPRLISAVPGANSVTLTWEKAQPPVSYYLVAYGTESGDYIYGNPDVGGPDTTGYTVTNLSGGKNYYFVVRAGNGCTPGPFSNEIGAVPYGSAIQGIGTGFYPGVLGEETAEGQLGEAIATGAGEVAGAEAKPVCWWWLILSLAEAAVLGLYYWRLSKEAKPWRFWWLAPVAMAIAAYIGDHYIAHRFLLPSKFCPKMWLWSILSSSLPTAGFLSFKKRK